MSNELETFRSFFCDFSLLDEAVKDSVDIILCLFFVFIPHYLDLSLYVLVMLIIAQLYVHISTKNDICNARQFFCKPEDLQDVFDACIRVRVLSHEPLVEINKVDRLFADKIQNAVLNS